ncbi:hypothetical protein JCM10207_006197 [Rhodosporidiobolus poonsookiae]
MRFFAFFLVSALVLAVSADPDTSPEPSRTLNKRGTSLLPCNADHPAPTPSFIPIADPLLMPVAQVAIFLTATTAGPLSVLSKAAVDLINSATTLNIGGVLKTVTSLVPNLLCSLFGCPKPVVTDPRPVLENGGAKNCLDSSTNATVINSLFYYGGAGTTVYLCPNANIKLETTIAFTAANQTLTTYGSVLGANRAKLTITDSGTSCAIYGNSAGMDKLTLSNVIIDGNRPNLGWTPNGLALIEMGGTTTGHTITGIKAYEPRGWSALHILEGNQNDCSGAVVTHNELGPSGNSPTGAAQFRMARVRRDTEYSPGQWADGISLACRDSTVTGNTITDATDGAIVIFGAPGSTIKGNTIVSERRVLLGGVNAVDYYPYLGSFQGVSVTGNTFNAKSTLMKVGIAAGPSTWGTSVAALTTLGGSFSGNTFTSGSKGYFGYGISVDGHRLGTFNKNNFVGSNFGGVFSGACQANMPDMQPTIYNPVLSTGNVLQDKFTASAYSLAICVGPGNITTSGVTYFGSS